MNNRNIYYLILSIIVIIAGFFASFTSKAQIIQVENLFGKYSLSVDGCENNNGGGAAGSCPITINKPVGATLYKAYLLASQTPLDTNPFAVDTPIHVNINNTYAGSIAPKLSTIASSSNTQAVLISRYGNVTAALSALLSSLPAGASTLYLMPDINEDNVAGLGLEGRTLLVIWNDFNSADKVISIALGSTTSLPPTTFTVNTPPLDVASAGSSAIAGLGINFSLGSSDQINNVVVNSTLITTQAGGFDDGDPVSGAENGNLFTIGDDADLIGPLTEKYNIKPALSNGSTAYTVSFQNVLNHSADWLSVYYSVVSGAFQAGTLGGTLYNDANSNSVFNTGEAGLPAGITVNLYRDVDGIPGLNILTDQLVGTTETNASGQYTFAGITVGTNYILQVDIADADIPLNLSIETANPELDIASVNGITSTTNFGFTADLVPVTLLDFDARRSGNKVLLSWHTSSEQNSDYFAVERSSTSSDFVFLGKLPASVHSNTQKTYSFTDNSPFKAKNYYRLKLVDKDGSSMYSETRIITFDQAGNLLLQPNPARSTTQLSGVGDGWKIQLIDSRGRLVRTEKASGDVLTISTANLPAGFYAVRIWDDHGLFVRSLNLVKEF